MEAEFELHASAFDRAAAQVPWCALDTQGLQAQRARHRRLAPAVTQSRRQGDVLVVDFAPDFDREALEELIAVERECCPFFAFSFDERSRHLEVKLRRPARPTLRAVTSAMTEEAMGL